MVKWLPVLAFLNFLIIASNIFATENDSLVVGGCESGNAFNNLGGKWYWYSDIKFDGALKIINKDAVFDSESKTYNDFVPTKDEGNSNGTPGYGARIDFEMNTDDFSFAGVGFALTHPAKTINMNGLKSISFWAKTTSEIKNLTVDVMVLTEPISDFGYYQKSIKISDVWTRYTVLVEAMVQPPWCELVELDLSKMHRVSFQVSGPNWRSTDSTGSLWIDDIVLYGEFPKVKNLPGRSNLLVTPDITFFQQNKSVYVKSPEMITSGLYTLYSLQGKKVLQRQLYGRDQKVFDVSNIVPGKYFVEIKTSDLYSQTIPLLISR